MIYGRCFTLNNAVECAANIVEGVRDISGLFAFAGTKVAHYFAASSLALLCLSSTVRSNSREQCEKLVTNFGYVFVKHYE